MKHSRLILCVLFGFACLLPAMGQRKTEKMDRGVVAMYKSSSQMYVSWRFLATDPEEISFNVYRKVGAQEPVKLNATPVSGSTNLTASITNATSPSTISVRPVLNGVEGEEDGSWSLAGGNGYYSRIVKDINYASIPGVSATMDMKFCWPADLTGNGKYDFVIDRQNYGTTGEDGSGGSSAYPHPRVEAYSSEGQFMWRINVGPNIRICSGHNDMVTAFDMDNDGKAEVMLIVGQGTVFANGDTIKGADGKVTDHMNSNMPGSPQQWLSIVDGMTGIEIDRAEIPYFAELQNTRTDSWKEMAGHFIIAYLDGINPSLIYQYKNRHSDGGFRGGLAAWRLIDKKLVLQWSHRDYANQHEFHQVRVADVNGDGCDDFVEGGYVISGKDGSILNRHVDCVHGDRHTLADIDPDRPGLEHFVIQQDNPKTLGMALYDAATGELIKGSYMSAVGDVGRGECAAYDLNTRGLQYFSTMNSNAMYDCKGNLHGGTGKFPGEPLWWGSNLNRMHTAAADGNGGNFIIESYNSGGFGRYLSVYNENNGNGTYYIRTEYGARAAFWGDILGDWREELIIRRSNGTGFCILSTSDETPHRIYCLMQNPAYRAQATARGYYQTADVDYYMAADMPKPPVPPVQKADLYYTGSGWIDSNDLAGTYTDGKSILFDIRGGNSAYTLNGNMSPSRVWIINPKDQDYTFSGAGKFTGDMDLIKSLQGTVTLNGNHDYTGITRISEGKMLVNGNLASKVRVDARGVIGGNGKLNGGIVLETGLNIEGGRIEPGNGADMGTLTIVGDLALPGRNNLHFDVDQTQPAKNDSLKIEGNFTVTGTNHSIVISQLSPIAADTLTLISFTGTSNATAANFKLRGLEGIPYTLLFEANSIRLAIREARTAGNVIWTGANSAAWDFETENFLNGAMNDIFVSGDLVTFNDDAARKNITIEETMPVGGMIFDNNTNYTVSGMGVISGSGGLTKTGEGSLSLLTTDNTFTGPVDISSSTLIVSSLKDGGLPSSIGASSNISSNWIMRNATLQTSAQMATNRNMQIVGKLTVNNPNANNSVLLSGNLQGSNTSLEVLGNGTLTLQGTNNFTGVTLRSGLLLLGSANANKVSLGSAKLTLMGGTLRLFDINSTSETGPFTNEIEVPEGSSARWDLPQRWNFNNKLTGGGTITINAPYVRSDFNGDWSQFTGRINFTGRDIRLNSTVARNMIRAEINLGSGTSLYVASNGSGEVSSGNTFTFGALSGSGGIAGRNTLNIGNKNINTTYSGIISAGSGSLNKQGTGIFTLTGNNLYTGNTDVSAGMLVVSNTAGSGTGTGNVSVRAGATLSGKGTVAGNVVIAAGGFIGAGDKTTSTVTSRTGTLTLEKNLTLAGTVTLEARNASTYPSDRIVIKGGLAINDGNLTVELIGGTTPFPLNAELQLLQITGSVTGAFKSIELPATVAGTSWDTSTLITNGKIRVIDGNTAINSIENGKMEVFVNENREIVVKCPAVNGLTASIFDSLGQMLVQQTLNSAETRIKQHFVSGIYFVKVGNKTNKVIVK